MVASREDRRFARTRSQVPLRSEVVPVDGRGFVDAHVEDQSARERGASGRYLRHDAFSSGP
jgi:hypothetical protein